MPYQITEQAAGMGARHRRAGVVRKVTRTAKALSKLAAKRMPRWAAVLVAVCLAIPGPLDELVVMPVLAVYLLARYRAEFATVARSTWDGTR